MKKILLTLSLMLLLSACTGGKDTNNQTTVSSETKTVATPTYGSGKHVAEVFADFQCPACIHFSKTIGPILEGYADKGKLQIVFHQYPLITIHKNAYRDAIAALCSAEQGKYMDYKKALYALEESKAGATVSDEDRVATAKTAGLNEGDMQVCLASDRYKAQVESELAYGDTRGIEGTPSVFLDGKKLDFSVFRDTDMLVAFLDRILSE